MHTKGITTVFCAIVAIIIFVTPAFAQEQDAAQFAFEPTGDALWDTYAQALLEQLPEMEFDASLEFHASVILPVDKLNAWEDEFGNDPRYWQLRYVHARNDLSLELSGEDMANGENQISQDGMGTTGAAAHLQQAVELGVDDAMTRMLLYEEQSDALREQWSYYDEQVDAGESPVIEGMDTDIPPHQWFEQRELELVDKLVASCPDESWAWYTRAMKCFEYGDWEDGLSDLKTGNKAPHNRLPMPFPMSYVIAQAGAEESGNETAFGVVASYWLTWPLPNFIRIKDQVKNQQARIYLGAPMEEFSPWYYYSCRLSTMENCAAVQWLVGLVIRNIILKSLLVDFPEAFSRDQRDTVFNLYLSGRKVRELVRYELTDDRGNNAFYRAMQEFEDKHGSITAEEMADLESERQIELVLELRQIILHQAYRQLMAEYGEIAAQAHESFDKMAAFDFATYSWPPVEEEPVPVELTVLPEPAREERLTTVVLETTKGDIELTVHHGWSPLGAARFIELVEAGYYDCAPWFRVVENFVAQCGIAADPAMTAQWQDSTIMDDPVVVGNTRGMVAFGKTMAPDSRSTHIYINLVDNSPGLDPQGFSSFAEVTGGMDVADSLLVTGNMTVEQSILIERGIEYFYELFPEGDIIVRAYIP